MIEWDEDTQSEFDLQWTPEYGEEIQAVPWCDCEQIETRRKVTASGQTRYYRQCTKCGRTHGAVLTSDIRDVRKVPDFNPNLHDVHYADYQRRRNEVTQKHIRLQRAAKIERRQQYESYLTSREWRKKREAVMKRAGGMCEGCGNASADHVHHLTYANLGNEFLWELVAVCRACHERVHGRKIGAREDVF